MKYTRNNLNKIGTYLYAEGIDAFKRSEAIKIVSDWRMTHLLPLREFVETVTKYFNAQSIHYAFYSQRIKRMTSIIEKLRLNESIGMRLGGLQDIGGVRFVFDTLDDMKACDIITEQNVRSVRPGYGLAPKYLPELLGKRVNRDLKKGDRMMLEYIN